MDRNHIPVMPMLDIKKNMSNKPMGGNLDPDVKAILKQQNNDSFNVLKMEHEPTNEEKKSKSSNELSESSEASESSDKKVIGYSWLVISLAVIVIILIIFIVWWVLGENKEIAKSTIPLGVIRPNIPDLHRGTHIQPGQPVFRTQSERMPIQTQNMPRPESQPSKKELESVLSQMNIETIPEENVVKKLKPNMSKQNNIDTENISIEEVLPETSSIETSIIEKEVCSDEVIDNALVASFNAKLQSDINNEYTEE
jgi:hypothetical protein